MNEFLRLPAENRSSAFATAADQLGISAGAVEKDFWVCWTLRELFRLDCGAHLTFKGGTSLSKCYGIIDRFSEDIDLVLGRAFLGFEGDNAPENAVSNSTRAKRLEDLKSACTAFVGGALISELRIAFQATLGQRAEDQVGLDPDADDRQTILFTYDSVTSGDGYIRPVVKVELGARSDVEPNEVRRVKPYVADALPRLIPNGEFEVRVVSAERTFWEKVSLLHEEVTMSRVPGARLSRHYYDLHCLGAKGVADRALVDRGLFERVREHRAIYFARRTAQRTLHRGEIRLVPSLEQRGAWESDYRAMRESMFMGQPPTFAELMESAEKLEARINELP